MWKYVLLKGDVYPLDTQEGVQAALAALWLSGDPHTEVWEKEDLDTSGTRTGNLLFRPVRLTINARYRMAEFWNALRKSLSARGLAEHSSPEPPSERSQVRLATGCCDSAPLRRSVR